MRIKYTISISRITIAELEGTRDTKLRERLRHLVAGLNLLEIPNGTANLAKAYIDQDIIPDDYINDALHIAVASLHN